MRFKIRNAALKGRRWPNMLLMALVHGDFPVVPIGHTLLHGSAIVTYYRSWARRNLQLR